MSPPTSGPNYAMWACRPHVAVWLITVTGQASNHHSAIPTLVSKQKQKVPVLLWSQPHSHLRHSTAGYYYMTVQKTRQLLSHKWSVSAKAIFCAVCSFWMLLTQPSSQRGPKRANRCTTNWSIYFIKYGKILPVCLSITTESPLITASIQAPSSAKSILPDWGCLSA